MPSQLYHFVAAQSDLNSRNSLLLVPIIFTNKTVTAGCKTNIKFRKKSTWYCNFELNRKHLTYNNSPHISRLHGRQKIQTLLIQRKTSVFGFAARYICVCNEQNGIQLDGSKWLVLPGELTMSRNHYLVITPA